MNSDFAQQGNQADRKQRGLICNVTETSELHGCITHGNSHTDALSNIKEAIDLWIKTAKKFDDPVPKTERVGKDT